MISALPASVEDQKEGCSRNAAPETATDTWVKKPVVAPQSRSKTMTS